MSKEAVDFLSQTGLDPTLLKKMEQLRTRGKIYNSKRDLLENFARISQDYGQTNLCYLASLGFSRSYGKSAGEIVFPNAVAHLKATRKEISKRLKQSRRSQKNEQKSNCACISYENITDKYQSIFAQPEELRLELIARFIANDYCQNNDYLQYFQILKEQDPMFIRLIINEPDGLDAIVPGVVDAASDALEKKIIPPDRVERASREYLKLMNEFHQTATHRGVGLTFVFIPVATHVDESFIRCWKPLRGKGKGDGRGPPMVKAVKSKIRGKIPFIDLTDYADQFQDCHWIFDGHWNDKGNASAARIVSDYILEHVLLTKKRNSSGTPKTVNF